MAPQTANVAPQAQLLTGNDPLLLVRQIARQFPSDTARGHVTDDAVYNWIHDGVLVNGSRVKLPAVRLGQRLYVKQSAFEKFLAQIETSATTQELEAQGV